MKKAAVTGYASMDYPAILDGYFKGDRTVMIRDRVIDAFPRPGGCPLYVARSIAKSGFETSLITWIGCDVLGEKFRSYAAASDISTDGIAIIETGSTPICLLIYQEDGSCGCCFDPGFEGEEALTPQQANILADVDLLSITVGPPNISRQALELIRDDTLVAWVAKNDPKSYPENLRSLFGQRADYIFCNVHEREWIDDAVSNRRKSSPIIVETNGAAGVKVEHGEVSEELPVPPLHFNDASGAGDTLAGGCMAAIMRGETDLRLIAAAGIEASYELLSKRA